MNLSKKHLKLKTKNFWRDNERTILLITGAFVLGVMIAGLNYLNYQNNVEKYNFEGEKTISNNENAEFSFQIESPSLATGTSMNLQINGASSSLPAIIYLNDEQLKEATSETQVIEISSERLEENNTVRIERDVIGFDPQTLVSASVTSRTNFQQLMFIILNLSAMLLIAAPIMYIKYNQYRKQKKMEEKFPEFLRDVVEGTRAGMSLPQAIQNTETGSYGPLDDKVEKMNAQLDWGIPFDQVLKNFGQETGSDVVKRSVDTIIQAYESGGHIQDVLESVGDNIRTIKQLKEERESQLYGEMITGYIVYFIFIGILVALMNFLLPNLATAQASLGGGGLSSFGGGGGASLQENITLYESWFQRLVFIQALFSGLIIGKLAEGELKAGFKHMAILFAVGYLATTFFL